MIRDLLNPSSGYLELREDSRGVVVAGISEVQAKKTSEVNVVPLFPCKQFCNVTSQTLNPKHVTPMCDQDRISPYNINTMSSG